MADRVRRALVRADRKSVGAQQADAIAALLRAPRTEVAAAMAGIDEAILRQWLEDPRFLARYRAARVSALEGPVARLQQLADCAVEALARNLSCGDPKVEVEAARAILAHAMVGMVGPVASEAGDKGGHGPGYGER